MPTQAIATQSKAQRALTEGAQQRKNNYPWESWLNNNNNSNSSDDIESDANYADENADFNDWATNRQTRLAEENMVSANQFDVNQTQAGGNTNKFNPIKSWGNAKDAARSNLDAADRAARNAADPTRSVPSGSFGISTKGRQQAARNKAQKRDQERNSRRGSAFR